MKIDEIKKLDDNGINKKVDEMRVSIFNMKMQRSATGMEKPHLIREMRKDIARLLMVKNSRKQ